MVEDEAAEQADMPRAAYGVFYFGAGGFDEASVGNAGRAGALAGAAGQAQVHVFEVGIVDGERRRSETCAIW